MIDKVAQGKKSRKKGRKFELDVRDDLESRGWIVCRWGNKVDFEKDKIVQAKPKFNPFRRIMALGTGFPDFIMFLPGGSEITGIECKGGKGGYLDKTEKKMAKWYTDHQTFSKFITARKPKIKSKAIEYLIFEDKEEVIK